MARRRRSAQQTLASRLRAQFDPIAGWAASVDPSTRRVHVDLPAGAGPLEFDPDDWDWVIDAQSKDPIRSLYLNSLSYLPLIAEHDPQAAQAALAAYDCFVRTPAFHGSVRTRSSWAQATALRLEAVALGVAEEWLAPGALSSSVFDADVEWVRRGQHVPRTNHGLFLVRAALSAAQVLAEHGDRRAGAVRDVVREHLPRILHKVLGDDGWSDENSAYQSYLWIDLLDRLRTAHERTLEELGLAALVRRSRVAVERTTAVQTFADGTLIPRGDTGLVRTDLRPPQGTHHSRRVGVWAHHGPHLGVLAVCGYADPGRKQRDDTALALRWRGQDVFLDGGSAGVVRGEPRGVALRRPTGHTCLTSDVLDRPTRELTADLREHGWARTEPEEPPADGASAAVVLARGRDGQFETRRRVAVLGTGLRIEDSWSSETGWRFGLRFLVPEELEVVVDPDGAGRHGVGHGVQRIELRGESVHALLTFSVPVEVEVVTGETERPHRGWRGLEEGRFEPAHSLEVHPIADTGAVRTDVELRPR